MSELINKEDALAIIAESATDTEAFEKVKALPPVESRWIPVTERLPELREDVLICLTYGEFVVSFLDKDFHDKTFWAYGLNSNDIVAWMPIPEYKGDNK